MNKFNDVESIMQCAVLGCSLFLFLPLCSGEVPAVPKIAEKAWSAKEHGNWSVAGNWSPPGVPKQEDKVLFNATSTKDCVVDIAVEVNSITMENTSYTGTVTQNKTIRVKKGFYLNGTKDGTGQWNPKDQIIESAGDWINAIGTKFDYYSSVIRLTGSGKLAGFLFNELEAAAKGNTTELISGIYIKRKVVLDGGSLKGNGFITFYGGSLAFKEKPAEISISGITFRDINNIPGAIYNCPLSIMGSGGEDGYTVLQGDIVCDELTIGHETKEKTAIVDTAGHRLTVTRGNLVIGNCRDKFGILKCKDSTIRIHGNVVINECSSVFCDESKWEIKGNLINNNGNFIKETAKINGKVFSQ